MDKERVLSLNKNQGEKTMTNQAEKSTFAHNLTRTRKYRLLTQEEVAARLGISKKVYAAYEDGCKEPRRDMLLKLVNLFNVTCDSLLCEFMTLGELCEKKAAELSKAEYREFLSDISLSYTFFMRSLLGKDYSPRKERKSVSQKYLGLFFMQRFEEICHEGQTIYVAILSPFGKELIIKELGYDSSKDTGILETQAV